MLHNQVLDRPCWIWAAVPGKKRCQARMAWTFCAVKMLRVLTAQKKGFWHHFSLQFSKRNEREKIVFKVSLGRGTECNSKRDNQNLSHALSEDSYAYVHFQDTA
jgi:hypothetical protein